MNITIEHVAAVDDELAERVGHAAAIIADRVPDPDKIDLVVTGDFVASVRARAATAQEASEYSTERGSGLAIAKTIPNGDRSFIIVPGPALSGAENVFDELGRHAISHEATHAALAQHGEATNDIRLRLAPSEAEGYYLASAGVIAEEYRVEASLAAEGSAPPSTYVSGIGDALDAARAAFLDAITLRYFGEPMDRPFRTAAAASHTLGIVLGYLAAELTSDDGSVPTEPPTIIAQTSLWGRLVGPGWPPIATVLSRLPPASERTSQDTLDQIVLDLAAALKIWIRHIGFAWRDTSTGAYFDVLRHDF